jgi:poly(A) polymerase
LELKKLLAAPDPSRALLWMRQAGVLTKALPESEKWGIDAIHGLVSAEGDLGWGADALLRLEAIVPPDAGRMRAMAERLKLSKAEAGRLEEWAQAPKIEPRRTESELAKKLYRSGRQPMLDRLRLALASARARAAESNDAMIEAGGYARQLKFAGGWEIPKFPLKGADLEAIGVAPGPEMGKLLKRLEEEWVESNFTLDRGALVERAAKHRKS